MKPIALLLVLIFLSSCGGDGGKGEPVLQDSVKADKPLTPEQKITLDVQQFMDKQVASAKKVTNILSGFTFGMSKQEVEAHSEKMLKKGNLKKVKLSSNKSEYVYQFPLSNKAKADTYMEADYKQEHLYKLVCRLLTPKGMGTADALAQAKAHLSSLYGNPAFTLPSFNSCDHFLWIDGNMHLDLKCEVDGVRFVYTDLTEERPLPEFDKLVQVTVTDVEHK